MKEHYNLPEEYRERLTRSESQAMEMFMTSISNLRYASDDLEKRIKIIPNGKRRMKASIGQLASVLTDTCGTIPYKQRNHLYNICKDMEVRLVPKMTAKRISVVLSVEEAKELVDAAQKKCTDCYKDEEESRGCKLRKLLECVVPLETYETCSCPYATAEWEED